jgi:homoserine dehydrogenase
VKNQINIGLLGCGTVGGGVILVLKENQDIITERVGCPIRIKNVLARHPEKVSALDPSLSTVDNIDAIINDPDIDIVVELMGREHPALEYMEAALKAGKNVVTANKDVVAEHGKELFELAADKHVDFLFEAAVAGGIPIIRPLKESLASNRISLIMGIVNGTTNYMLTKMSAEHMDFAEVLKEAQEKGYAESDPTADIGGFDAARKIAILSSIAFNSRIGLKDVSIEGIEKISLRDIEYAEELGYVLKLLGIAKQYSDKKISVGVHPTMLPKDHPLASINDVFNAVYIEGKPIGEAMFFGRGAGRFPTASAACGDIIEISRNIRQGCTGRVGCTCYEVAHLADEKEVTSPYYVRLLAEDVPGVLAKIAGAFGNHGVSLKTVVQKRSIGTMAEIVVITRSVSEYDMKLAADELDKESCVSRISNIIRVEDSTLTD